MHVSARGSGRSSAWFIKCPSLIVGNNAINRISRSGRQARISGRREVTQIFPTESHARLRFIDGYMESLWRGDPHRHRDDVVALRVARASIHSRDGVLKDDDVPVIMAGAATDDDRRRALYEAVRTKDAKGYPSHGYRHVNLVVLDWFGLEFDASEYSAHQLFGPGLKELLRRCAFNEIFFVLEDTTSRGVESRTRQPRYVLLGSQGVV